MRVLVTGGAGYIGSHTCKALAAAGHEPIAFDDLSTGHRSAVKYGSLVEGDIRNELSLCNAFRRTKPEAVIHFAASAYVGVSVSEPLAYYRNNVVGTLNLLDAMKEHGVDRLVFSSSCATYGEPQGLPITELETQKPINPYGNTKLVCEQMSRDLAASDPRFQCTALRYFNAAGADQDGELGEIHSPETHIIPLILLSFLDPSRQFTIYGDDYATADGTCIRDYIHVDDLATAHINALEKLSPGFRAYNLGSGRGYSVREIVSAAERITGKKLNFRVGSRRPGDPPILLADPSRARNELGWKTKASDLDVIVETAWNFYRSRRH